MPSRLAYAIFYVSDLERSIRFYRDVVELPFRFSNESYAEFGTDAPSSPCSRAATCWS